MSRNLEKTPKTKFRKTQSEEKVDKAKNLPKQQARVEPRGFDMWEDEEVSSDGC